MLFSLCRMPSSKLTEGKAVVDPDPRRNTAERHSDCATIALILPSPLEAQTEIGLMDVNMKTVKMASINGINCVHLKPFNMRSATMANFAANEKRPLYRAHGLPVNRFREQYLIRDADQSVCLLRQLLQDKINSEIESILYKYYDLFFKPALHNIHNNLRGKGDTYISDKKIFREILEQTLKRYCDFDSQYEATTSQNEHAESPYVGQFQCNRTRGRPARAKGAYMKNQKGNSKWKQRLKLKAKAKQVFNPLDFNVADCKWDTSRLTADTLFVLSSTASKALGFATTRGRFFAKHTNIFRYIGDQEDKDWLLRNQLMPPTGNKAYFLVRDDIIQLIHSKEYENIAGINAQDLGEGFTVPPAILNKMTSVMASMKKRLFEQRAKISDADCTYKGNMFELSNFDSELSSSFESTFDLVNNSTENSQS